MSRDGLKKIRLHNPIEHLLVGEFRCHMQKFRPKSQKISRFQDFCEIEISLHLDVQKKS